MSGEYFRFETRGRSGAKVKCLKRCMFSFQTFRKLWAMGFTTTSVKTTAAAKEAICENKSGASVPAIVGRS